MTLFVPGKSLEFYLLSQVSNVTDNDLRRLATASAIRSADVSLEWGMPLPSYTCVSKLDEVPASGIPVVFMPSLDAPGAAAYHSVTPDGREYCRVLADSREMTLAQIQNAATHEFFETMGDPQCNVWCQDFTGRLWARELCDAVEGDDDSIDLGDGLAPVKVSNFCTQAYFCDTNPPGAKFDFRGLLTGPWQIRPGGYAMVIEGGKIKSLPDGLALADRKFHPTARPSKRLGTDSALALKQ